MNTHHCFHPYTDKISTMSNLLSNQRFKNLQRFNKCRIKMLSTRCQYNSHSKKCNFQNNNFFKFIIDPILQSQHFDFLSVYLIQNTPDWLCRSGLNFFLEKSEYLYEIQKKRRVVKSQQTKHEKSQQCTNIIIH